MIKILHSFFKKNKTAISILEKITGSKIHTSLPLGLDPILDIQYSMPQYLFNTIMDVGANTGQSENYFNKTLPGVDIFCFEPVTETYLELKKNIKGINTKAYNIGLGSETFKTNVKIDKNHYCSDTFSLNQKEHSDYKEYFMQEVSVETLSDFFRNNSLSNISLLKIDTEGYDLEVLKGSLDLLSNDKIDFINVEVSMNKFNSFHVSFEDVNNFLATYNYSIFGIYDQIHDFKIKKPILRRVNVMYVSNSVSQIE